MVSISDKISYVSEESDTQKIKENKKRYDEIMDMPLKQIIDLWDASQEHGTEEGKILSEDYFLIPAILKQMFYLPDLQNLNDSITTIKDAIDALDAKIRNHRHPLSETYSAKPEF